MKQIENFIPEKYDDDNYIIIEQGIYKTEHKGEILFVTSLSFAQEPEYEEGVSSSEISQYPLEDILDKFYCYISDFYEQLNGASTPECYLEFAASDINDIKNLRTILGRHVYNKEIDGRIQLLID